LTCFCSFVVDTDTVTAEVPQFTAAITAHWTDAFRVDSPLLDYPPA